MSHNPQTHTTNTQCVRVCRHVLVLVVCILSSCRSAWTALCLLLYASCLLLFCFDCRGEDIACVCCCASAWEQPRGEPVLSFFFCTWHRISFHFLLPTCTKKTQPFYEPCRVPSLVPSSPHHPPPRHHTHLTYDTLLPYPNHFSTLALWVPSRTHFLPKTYPISYSFTTLPLSLSLWNLPQNWRRN